ncbi:MAG: hypothetical protein RSB88_05235, partial [Akkermansia sp.]
VEMPLVFVLCNMEREGVKIQTQALADFGTHLREQLANLEQEIFTLAGLIMQALFIFILKIIF